MQWRLPVQNELLRHTGIVFTGMLAVHLLNLLFQMAVSRALPAAEYALLAAFLGFLMIVQHPLTTLTTALSRYSQLLVQAGRAGDIKRLLIKWLLLTGLPALALGSFLAAGHRLVMGWLHLDRPEPVLVAGLILPALFWAAVLNGAGQGLQLFKWCAAAAASGALLRLLLGAGLVWFWVPACGWAMLGHGVGLYTAVAVLAIGCYWTLCRAPRSQETLPHLRQFMAQGLLVQLAFAVLMTADVILVKHFVPTDTEFAYAATLGRLVVFLPSAIVPAMFPKVVAHGTGTTDQERVFQQAFRWTLAFVVASVVAVAGLARPLALILFGINDPSLYLIRLIQAMAAVMGLTALLNILLHYHLAQRRFAPTWPVVGCAAAYLGASFIFHATAWAIVAAAATTHAVATVVLWYSCCSRAR